MSPDTDSQFQPLFDRIAAGDAAARRELLAAVVPRVQHLCAKKLRLDFPAVGLQRELDSVVNEAWPRVARILEAADVPTLPDFMRLVGNRLHYVLLDFADRLRRQPRVLRLAGGEDSGASAVDPADATPPPPERASWHELLRRADGLPDLQREVFRLHHLAGYTQAEVAHALGESPKRVSRAWLAAVEALGVWLRGEPER